jgi:penicillin-binding protein 1A
MLGAGDDLCVLAEKPKVWMTAPTAPAQYFIDWLDAQARQAAGSAVKQDLVVETTLDLPSELAAADAAKAVTARYAKQGVEQAAVVTLDGFGRVRTLVGGVDYQKAPFNRAVNAKRQPGSAWKPFVYLAALEAGRTPDTPVVDEQVTINGWTPRNYEPGFMGPITLGQALTHSINTVAARLGEEVGRANIAIVARRMGIMSPINTDPAMALGTSLVSPLELAQAYDPLGNGGFGVRAYGIERIRAGGKVIYQRPQPKLATVVQNPAMNQMQQMMRAVMTSGTGVNAAIPGYDLAGKTGTTSDYRDAWFAGYTGGMVTVVWVGRDNNKPMVGVTGAKAPSEIWKTYMRTALKRLPNGAIPPGAPASLPVGPTPVVDPAQLAPQAAATPTSPS